MSRKIITFSVIGGALASLLAVKPIREVLTRFMKIKKLKEWAKAKTNYLLNKYNLPSDPLGLNTRMIKSMGLDRWNQEKLKSLVPEFRSIVSKILEDAKKEGFNKLMLYETIRSLDRQVGLYFKGTALGTFMSKKGGHLWGRAVDIVWYDPPKSYWDLPKGMYTFLKKESQKYGLHGPWYNDQCHVQLQTGLTSGMVTDITNINNEFFAKVKEYGLA